MVEDQGSFDHLHLPLNSPYYIFAMPTPKHIKVALEEISKKFLLGDEIGKKDEGTQRKNKKRIE